ERVGYTSRLVAGAHDRRVPRQWACMRVALIYAKSQGIPRKAGVSGEDHQTTAARPGRDEIYPPLGISILGAELLELGHEVRLLDDSLRSMEELREAMRWA